MPQQAQFQIVQAIRERMFAKLAFIGLEGTGKTYSSLAVAQGLVPEEGGRVVVIDTEHGKSRLYANKFDFDVLDLSPETVPYKTYSPETYSAAIRQCADAGYSVIIVDSLSHAWMGKDGALESVEQIGSQRKGGSFNAWSVVRPQCREMMETILAVPCAVIVTMRVKADWDTSEDDRGKMRVQKIGTRVVQSEDSGYEFDVVFNVEGDNRARVQKTRLDWLFGQIITKPDGKLGKDIRNDLNSGAVPERKAPPAAAPEEETPEAAEGGEAPAAPAWAWNPASRSKAEAAMTKMGWTPAMIEYSVERCHSLDDTAQLAAWMKAGHKAPEGWEEHVAASATTEAGEMPDFEGPGGGEVRPLREEVGSDRPSPPAPLPGGEGSERTAGDGNGTMPSGSQSTQERPPAGAPEHAAPAEGTSQGAMSPADMLRVAKDMVRAQAVPPEEAAQIQDAPTLRAAISDLYGISGDNQEKLLEQLGIDESWDDLSKSQRLALLWLAANWK